MTKSELSVAEEGGSGSAIDKVGRSLAGDEAR